MTKVANQIGQIAGVLQNANSGPLAQLRRMTPKAPKPPIYWRMHSQFNLGGGVDSAWPHIVQCMAILTPRGDVETRISPHACDQPLGQMLCDGGRGEWTSLPEHDRRPLLSEKRLARLLTSRGKMRVRLMLSAARMVASVAGRTKGVNCTELAWFLLRNDPKHDGDLIARSYYGRLTLMPATDSAQSGEQDND